MGLDQSSSEALADAPAGAVPANRTADDLPAVTVPVRGAPDRLRAPEDEPIREDVRQLGDLLGEVLRAQEGPALFELV